MINGLKNMISQVLYAPSANALTGASSSVVSNNNPFANPFMQQSSYGGRTYGVNKPVKGGYFAGYINGKPNIVGRKLFIEA